MKLFVSFLVTLSSNYLFPCLTNIYFYLNYYIIYYLLFILKYYIKVIIYFNLNNKKYNNKLNNKALILIKLKIKVINNFKFNKYNIGGHPAVQDT
jgi:hypothetical protein